MRTLRGRIWLAAMTAAGLVGCGGSLTAPDASVVDSSVFALPDAGGPGIRDAPPLDGAGMNPCPDQIAERVDGTSCLFLILNAAVCTGIGIRVQVIIDGQEVPQVADDGWTYADAAATSIELHGAACEGANRSLTGATIRFAFYLA
jgi:hypothetical protein